ncbi:hypothetical protein CTI12_AA000110 [Artemisia annua]|uniref:Reverse transcriptase domain-containing protein n=1 Tax=Artemisia annua TaxID=35608 RepID=A0A2U1QJP0_ARTAN|nr:hypothetical protein CTI12_AA000110 [Artemisia annua]
MEEMTEMIKGGNIKMEGLDRSMEEIKKMIMELGSKVAETSKEKNNSIPSPSQGDIGSSSHHSREIPERTTNEHQPRYSISNPSITRVNSPFINTHISSPHNYTYTTSMNLSSPFSTFPIFSSPQPNPSLFYNHEPSSHDYQNPLRPPVYVTPNTTYLNRPPQQFKPYQGQYPPNQFHMTQWHNNKPPKMDFPKFEGSDPRGWVIRSNQYFEFHPMDEIRKAKYASTYFEGRASRWYQFYHIGREWITWGDFTQDVVRRFTSSEHTNPQAEFNKLRQISTLDVYLDEFEELRAYVVAKQPGLTDEYFMSSFISGLKEEIKGAVIMATSSTFEEVIMLAKQADINIQKARTKPTFTISKNSQNFSQTTNSQPKTYTRSYTEQNSSSSPKLTPQHPTINKSVKNKMLSSAEVHERRRQGLCFNCDDKFSPGHVCKARLYHMYGEEDDSSEDDGGVISQSNMDEAEVMGEDCHISLHALTGVATYKTIKLKGLVNKHTLTILVDSGATHNFIDPTTLRKLGCVEEYSTPLIVKVGDGNKLSSDSKCSKFKWITQGQTFEADLRVLTLGGCDMVLGVEWLRRYSPVTFDYDLTEVTLSDSEKKIVLKGTTEEGSLSMISGEGFNKLLKKTKHGLVGYLLYMGCDSTNEKIPSCIQGTIQQYKNVFDEPKGLPPVRRHDHKIPLKEGSQPISQRPYRTPYIQKSEIEKQVKEMLSSGIIQYSNSPFASPVLLVLKKDGSWRLCVDYRRLNDITIKDKFPIPVIEELLDELNGAKWFTKLDLRSGYHQIRVAEEDIPKTAFRTHHGHFEFKVMPFGLTNAPASFQSLMNEVFEPYLRKSVLVFFDDILVFSRSLEEHVKHLEEVLQVMTKHQLFAKMSKCSFAQRELEYLGHIISEKGVAADPKKIEVMKLWPTPVNIKQLRGFLGLTGYYRRFVKGYGVIAKPLTQLLKKHGFEWSSEAETSFNQLKEAMISTPVLRLPDFTLPFIVETDACNVGVGAVLMQQGQPITFLSKGLSKKNQLLSTYEKEFLAVVMAINKWRPYLQGHHFIIKTDQQSLKYFLEQRVTSLLQQKWLAKLMGLDYEIVYKKGTENKVADALSRLPLTEGECNMITTTTPTWITEIGLSYEGDGAAMEFLILATDKENNGGWSLQQGLLKKEGKIFVGSSGGLRKQIITEMHGSSFGGHSGRDVTLKRVSQFFYWPSMKTEIK